MDKFTVRFRPMGLTPDRYASREVLAQDAEQAAKICRFWQAGCEVLKVEKMPDER